MNEQPKPEIFYDESDDDTTQFEKLLDEARAGNLSLVAMETSTTDLLSLAEWQDLALALAQHKTPLVFIGEAA